MTKSARQFPRSLLAAFLPAGLWLVAALGVAWQASLGIAQLVVLLLVPVVAVLAELLRRMQDEDRMARLEASWCRERGARGQADRALAEADLLLVRVAARSRQRGADPAGQMLMIHAELAQLERQLARHQPQLAQRLAFLCRRVEGVTATLRKLPRAAGTG